MLQDRLTVLFSNYDPIIRQIIHEVGEVEQQFISMDKPRGIYNRIDEIITRIVEEEIRQTAEKGE